MQTVDSQGVPIKVGDKVAYNYSGEVVPGVVVEVNEPRRVNQWHVKHSVRIDNGAHISHVRNNRSILVLP